MVPGAWEIKNSNRVLVGILHTDNTTMSWSFGLRNLIVPGHILPVSGMPYDMSRNMVCAKALESGFEYVFFLDSDVVPPRDAILRLMRHNLPIVSGVYHRRSPPHGVPVMMRPVGQWITHYPPNSLIEVDVVGAGCLLLHRSLLEAFAKTPQRPGHPWFDWRVNMQGILPQGECLSEDFTLNTHARKLGYRTMVDTSVQCKHTGLADFTYNDVRPCEIQTVT